MMRTFGQAFNYQKPRTENDEPLHHDVEQLLAAAPTLKHLQAGSSDLAQVTYKVIRNTNMMRMQQQRQQEQHDEEYRRLVHESNRRRQTIEESMKQYKQGLIDARE